MMMMAKGIPGDGPSKRPLVVLAALIVVAQSTFYLTHKIGASYHQATMEREPARMPPSTSIEWFGRATEQVLFLRDPSTAVTVHRNDFPASTFWPDFWTVVNNGAWESDTLVLLKHFLKDHPDASYIDFGAWVGPTVLLAAQYSRHVFALEPDPLAYSALVANVNLNPKVKKHAHVVLGCIGAHDGPVEFQGIGDSTSRTADAFATGGGATGKAASRWTLNCSTLSTFIAQHHIHNLRLIKMDTEGGELYILPSLISWLQSLPQPKPAIWLAVHRPFWKPGADQQTIQDFWGALKLYKHVYRGISERVGAGEWGCEDFCSFLLTDEELRLSSDERRQAGV